VKVTGPACDSGSGTKPPAASGSWAACSASTALKETPARVRKPRKVGGITTAYHASGSGPTGAQAQFQPSVVSPQQTVPPGSG